MSEVDSLIENIGKESLAAKGLRVLDLAVQLLFGHPKHLSISANVQNIRQGNSYLNNYLSLLQNILALKRAQDGLKTVEMDVAAEKCILSDKIEAIYSTLMTAHLQYLEKVEHGKDTFMIKSDIQLKLADYERIKDLYALYNHIDDLVSRTLSETERIEKLAFYSKQFDSLNSFKITKSVGFENTLDSLLVHMEQFDRTKEYINSQLSVARSSNISTAVVLGTQAEKSTSDSILNKFLLNGSLGKADDEKTRRNIRTQKSMSHVCNQPSV